MKNELKLNTNGKVSESENYVVVDDFCDKDYFKFLQDQVMSHDFPWLYQAEVANPGENKDEDFYFTHRIFENNNPISTFFNPCEKLFQDLDVKAVVRARVLLFVNQGKKIIHDDHIDFYFPHKTALLYLNTNNGSTGFKDGTRVDSIENRVVLFDGSTPHNSSTCTDQKVRVVFSVNYF
tara:strand:+ start:673 stop:1209 length:537 start_codon:yes stop_codon:yes gene_type:complete